jgi:hypothetical protein
MVEELEHRLEDIDERLEDVGKEEHVHALAAGARGLKNRWASTGSTPPRLQGLQRSSRHPARTSPRSMPNLVIACAAYSEQDG